MRVRPARERDAGSLARIHARSWRWAYRELLPATYLDSLAAPLLREKWERRLVGDDPEDVVHVAEVDGRVRGFVTFGPHHDPAWLGFAGEVFMLYVDPELVGMGVGHRLLERAAAELARVRCYWMVIWVLARNERAQRFYERDGLRPDGGKRWDLFAERSVPVIRYARAINPLVDFHALGRPSRAR